MTPKVPIEGAPNVGSALTSAECRQEFRRHRHADIKIPVVMNLLRNGNKFVSASNHWTQARVLDRRPLPPNRTYHHQTRKFPDLLYFPHVFRWMSMKLKFKYLQKMWDPDFTEGSFIYGTTRAICRITEIIHSDQPEQLRNLLTFEAERNLRDDMEFKLTKVQKEVIRLKPHDIKLFVPMRVQLVRDDKDNRSCQVLLKSLSMKWYDDKKATKLALIVIETEFKRDYTKEARPDWIISVFDIVQCVLIGGGATSI